MACSLCTETKCCLNRINILNRKNITSSCVSNHYLLSFLKFQVSGWEVVRRESTFWIPQEPFHTQIAKKRWKTSGTYRFIDGIMLRESAIRDEAQFRWVETLTLYLLSFNIVHVDSNDSVFHCSWQIYEFWNCKRKFGSELVFAKWKSDATGK